MKVLDVPVEPTALSHAERVRRSRWDGTESRWTQAARAAAPWPLWSLLVALGLPGAPHVPDWMHGVLAVSLVLGLMVAWTHRPSSTVIATRWLPSILGSGLLGELLATSLTRGGGGLATMDAMGRALSLWLICVTIYEITPMLAAASRVSAREHRPRSLDVAAHLVFLALAAGAYLWAPRHGAWFVSPWIAAIVALPLTAARSGPDQPSQLPAPRVREGTLWALALVAWSLVALLFIGDHADLAGSARRIWRRGTDPLEGALFALPVLSIVLSLLAAATQLVRARHVRRAPSGLVTGLGDGGLTLERAGEVEPTWVTVEAGGLPADGATVTLIGARVRGADAGPFRDGAPRLRAQRVFVGTPEQLSRALVHRAAAWVVWAAAGTLGIWLRLV